MMIATVDISSVAWSDSAEMLSRLDPRPVALGSKANPRLLTRRNSLITLLLHRLPTALHIKEPRAPRAALGAFCGKSAVVDRLVRLFREEEEVSTLRTIGSNQAEIRRTDFWPAIEQHGGRE
jgi:hypothetical protein